MLEIGKKQREGACVTISFSDVKKGKTVKYRIFILNPVRVADKMNLVIDVDVDGGAVY